MTMERQGHRATVPFGALIYEPSNNIYVCPTTLFISTTSRKRFWHSVLPGCRDNSNLMHGEYLLRKLLVRRAASPISGRIVLVFLYRGETREVAERIGIDCSQFPGPIIPVIYNVNFRDPAGYFLAKTFEMRNKDVVYVSNAVTVETSKFLEHLRLIMATVNDPIVYTTNAYTLKAAIQGTGNVTTITTPTPLSSTRLS